MATYSNRIIGAIIGDIVGSTYEFAEKIPTKFKLFRSACSFTDDTVLTVAIADALLHGRSFADAIEDWGNRYIYAGFGHSFREWKKQRKNNPAATNNSKGNGCGMRVSPVGFWAKQTITRRAYLPFVDTIIISGSGRSSRSRGTA